MDFMDSDALLDSMYPVGSLLNLLEGVASKSARIVGELSRLGWPESSSGLLLEVAEAMEMVSGGSDLLERELHGVHGVWMDEANAPAELREIRARLLRLRATLSQIGEKLVLVQRMLEQETGTDTPA